MSHPHLLINIGVYDLAGNLGAKPDTPASTWRGHLDGINASFSAMVQRAGRRRHRPPARTPTPHLSTRSTAFTITRREPAAIHRRLRVLTTEMRGQCAHGSETLARQRTLIQWRGGVGYRAARRGDLVPGAVGISRSAIDEDQVWAFARRVRDFAHDIDTTHQAASCTLRQIGSACVGSSYERPVAVWARMTSAHMHELVEACHTVGASFGLALDEPLGTCASCKNMRTRWPGTPAGLARRSRRVSFGE